MDYSGYDLSSYRCSVCNKPITMKEFADGVAGRLGLSDRAVHNKCDKEERN